MGASLTRCETAGPSGRLAGMPREIATADRVGRVELPEAVEPLVDYYRSFAPELAD